MEISMQSEGAAEAWSNILIWIIDFHDVAINILLNIAVEKE